VDIPWDELGTGWVLPGGNEAWTALLNRVEKGEPEGICGNLASAIGGTCG